MVKINKHIVFCYGLLVFFAMGQISVSTHFHKTLPEELCLHNSGINHAHHNAVEKCLLCEGGIYKTLFVSELSQVVFYFDVATILFYYGLKNYYCTDNYVRSRGPPVLC